MKYRVKLCYVKDFLVEADNENDAIEKAHYGDVISEGSFDAVPEYDEAEEE